ncbi:hypothetical protein [Adlercreutzia sp. ZJ141]|uniref:hypothetical protein n=1 Tax=Adlercreutzia sp. ZJ141 TaxID=2709406 RepID=UPI0013EDA356|nr:hypothetical protein [Adlercreutzia sp. ZJ141]
MYKMIKAAREYELMIIQAEIDRYRRQAEKSARELERLKEIERTERQRYEEECRRREEEILRYTELRKSDNADDQREADAILERLAQEIEKIFAQWESDKGRV